MGGVRQLRDDDGASRGGKIPPHSLQAEEAVLGGVLVNNAMAGAAFEIAEPEYFYREAHRKIAAAMGSLLDADDGIDLVTLGELLKSRGQLEEIGGLAHLAELSDRVPTAGNICAHAKIVKRNHLRRQLISSANRFSVDLFNSGDLVGYAADHIDTMMVLAGEAKDRETLSQSLVRVQRNIDDLTEGKAEPAIKTGLVAFDRMTGGLRPGHMYTLGGRSSEGKTSTALNLVNGPLDRGVGVGLFSPDAKVGEVIPRLVGIRAGIESTRIQDGDLDASEQARVSEEMARIDDLPLQIVDDEYEWSRAKLTIRRMAADGARIVIIDHLTLLTNSSGGGEHHVRMSGIARDIQELVSRTGLAIILLDQLGVDSDTASKPSWRPTEKDLKGTKAVHENANEVLLVHWPGKTNPITPDEEEKKVRFIGDERWELYRLYVHKQKMGDTGGLKFLWHPPTMRLRDWFDEQPGFFGGDG